MAARKIWFSWFYGQNTIVVLMYFYARCRPVWAGAIDTRIILYYNTMAGGRGGHAIRSSAKGLRKNKSPPRSWHGLAPGRRYDISVYLYASVPSCACVVARFLHECAPRKTSTTIIILIITTKLKKKKNWKRSYLRMVLNRYEHFFGNGDGRAVRFR